MPSACVINEEKVAFAVLLLTKYYSMMHEETAISFKACVSSKQPRVPHDAMKSAFESEKVRKPKNILTNEFGLALSKITT